ncbi:MAG: DUF4874 domain-containing protein, partial [Burkholderiaceae bacterium]|nr:DUF4874 domain-containing protein [Burkholderiaceae bacterium]
MNNFSLDSAQGAYNAGQRLVLGKIQLDSFRASDLSDSFLSNLSARLATVRAAGMKVTLLFSYDFSGGGRDATAYQIKR